MVIELPYMVMLPCQGIVHRCRHTLLPLMLNTFVSCHNARSLPAVSPSSSIPHGVSIASRHCLTSWRSSSTLWTLTHRASTSGR